MKLPLRYQHYHDANEVIQFLQTQPLILFEARDADGTRWLHFLGRPTDIEVSSGDIFVYLPEIQDVALRASLSNNPEGYELSPLATTAGYQHLVLRAKREHS